MLEQPSDSGALLVVRIPYEPETVRYRPYAERLETGTVIDWALSRFQAGKPAHTRIACVAPNENERARVADVLTPANDTLLVSANGNSEPDFCRRLMDAHGVKRLIVTALEHAIAPHTSIRDVVRIHDANAALLTDVQARSFATPFYVVESALVDRLMVAMKPRWPLGLIDAALRLFQESQGNASAAEIRWQRLRLETLSRVDAGRWPERIEFKSARDVATLRDAVRRRSLSVPKGRHFLDMWKESSRAIRDQKHDSIPVVHQAPLVRPKERIRVLYVSSLSHFVGASQSLCHLIDGLDRRRFEASVLVPFEGVFADELRKRHVNVIVPNIGFTTQSVESVRLAQRVVKEVDPDLVHGNHSIGLPLMAVTTAMGVPLVQHVRLASIPVYKLEIHAADAVIAVSEFIRQRVIELDVEPAKVSVILDGVDVEEFTHEPARQNECRRELGIPADEFVVSVVARVHPQKRIETVIEALGGVRQAIGRGHLLLVGSSEADGSYYDRLWRLIQQADLTTHFTRIAFTLDVPTVFRASDVTVLVSVNEALARVVVEAMAVGIPVIVGDSGGSREVMEHDRTGFVVRCGDVEGLTSLLCSLAADPRRGREVGKAAAEAVRSQLTDARCAEQTGLLYERVLENCEAAARSLSTPLRRCSD